MKRVAVVDNSKLKHKEEKLHIQSLCPVNRGGTECIYFQGEKLYIDERTCIGCGICSKAAPKAISIINFPDESEKEVLHQYGENSFRIFDLPLLQEGSITAIVGKNGIGKSTVINILSNTIKANFGHIDKEYSEKEYFDILTKKFRGSALQNYFSKLETGEIKISYKPQQITNIPKFFSGNVLDLLKNVVSDEEKIKYYAEKLNISNLLEREVEVLSGGELQRLALCSSLLKDDSTTFIFDEITNYLDIYERLNSSSTIREVTKNKTSLVVEHDLVVLDYLADYTHIMYGQPAVYGMLTGTKSGKEGINEYLEGYSKEENVRFRDKKITFDKSSIIEDTKIEKVATWNEDNIQRGDFKLNISEGEIKKGEVMGIIGRNGLGKSTFINYIASEGFDNATVSYKPQLIPKEDEPVVSVLSQYKNYSDNFYQLNVIEPLNIKDIEETLVSSLSGGELQRFAIAKALLEDADVFLLDEPTAFLDIEDRLKVSKTLKNFIQLKEKSAFIIDHDLVFIDYLSDRLLVFEGVPGEEGTSSTPHSMREGMNKFLKGLDITFRRDENNKRPRVNKKESTRDKEQKSKGEFYYA